MLATLLSLSNFFVIIFPYGLIQPKWTFRENWFLLRFFFHYAVIVKGAQNAHTFFWFTESILRKNDEFCNELNESLHHSLPFWVGWDELKEALKAFLKYYWHTTTLNVRNKDFKCPGLFFIFRKGIAANGERSQWRPHLWYHRI